MRRLAPDHNLGRRVVPGGAQRGGAGDVQPGAVGLVRRRVAGGGVVGPRVGRRKLLGFHMGFLGREIRQFHRALAATTTTAAAVAAAAPQSPPPPPQPPEVPPPPEAPSPPSQPLAMLDSYIFVDSSWYGDNDDAKWELICDDWPQTALFGASAPFWANASVFEGTSCELHLYGSTDQWQGSTWSAPGFAGASGLAPTSASTDAVRTVQFVVARHAPPAPPAPNPPSHVLCADDATWEFEMTFDFGVYDYAATWYCYDWAEYCPMSSAILDASTCLDYDGNTRTDPDGTACEVHCPPVEPGPRTCALRPATLSRFPNDLTRSCNAG